MGKIPLEKRTKKQAKYYLHLHRQAKKREVAANIGQSGQKAAEKASQSSRSEEVREAASSVDNALHSLVLSQDERNVRLTTEGGESVHDLRDSGTSSHVEGGSLTTTPAGDVGGHRSEDEMSIFADDDI